MIIEGISIRRISQITGTSKNTVIKLLLRAGRVFCDYQDKSFCNLSSSRIHLNQTLTFSNFKSAPDVDDVWTWTASDMSTKLIISWLVADRSRETASIFVATLATRFKKRIQITSRINLDNYPPRNHSYSIGFNKRFEKYGDAITIYFMHHNFCRIDHTIGLTPAMQAGLSDHAWSTEELVNLLDRVMPN